MADRADFILAKIDSARMLLVEARDASDAKKIADLARAAEVYAQRQGASDEVIEYATGIKIEALTLLGEFIKAGPKNTGTRGQLNGRNPSGTTRKEAPENKMATLPEMGIPHKQSVIGQALADVKLTNPELHAAAMTGKASIPKVLFEVKHEKAKAARHERAKEAEKIGHVDGFVAGDFREVAKSIKPNSVDLIFTDPPYDRKTLPLYGDLARIGAEKLIDGGSLICYLGQYLIADVLNLMTPHLRLWWTLAVIHTGRSARMNEYGIVVKWKPLLWFVKRTRADKLTFVDDLVTSSMEKDTHDWQQSVIEARYYIERLAPKGGMVFDPFCGGGTTAAACKEIGRKFLTCDVDRDSLSLAKERAA